MKYAGWTRWSSDPRSKYHYFEEDLPHRPGWFTSACGGYGIHKIQGFDAPPEDRKCKICLNYMRRSSEVKPEQ